MKILTPDGILSWEEYAIRSAVSGEWLSLPEGFDGVLSREVLYEDEPVDVVVLGVEEGRLIAAVDLPYVSRFDSSSPEWRDCELRSFLNSDVFLNRFDCRFKEAVAPKEVRTGDYVTEDRFWLFSHEEVGYNNYLTSLRPNRGSESFRPFLCLNNTKARAYISKAARDNSQARLSRQYPDCICMYSGWWLRSRDPFYSRDFSAVAYVNEEGILQSARPSVERGLLIACSVKRF